MCADNVTSIPGSILRFMITITLTSDVDSSYRGISIISGVMRDRIHGWWYTPAVFCNSLPCNYSSAVRTVASKKRHTHTHHTLRQR
jgi:hypothetical protein